MAMAYYLTVQTNQDDNDKFMALDITKEFEGSLFKKSPHGCPTFKKNAACSIDEIDYFTSRFSDSKQLKKYLIMNDILPVEYIDKPLSIRYYKKNECNKIKYGLLYEKDTDNINHPEVLIARVMSKLGCNADEIDLNFLDKFCRRFADNLNYSTSFRELCLYVGDSIHTHFVSRYLFKEDSEDHLVPLERVVCALIFKNYFDRCSKAAHKELNYRNIHDLIAFLNYYDNDCKQEKKLSKEDIKELLKLKKEMLISHDETYHEITEEEIADYKTRKKTPIKGQLSFF